MEPFATLVAHLQQFGCIELAEDRVDVHCFYETSFIASVIDADRPIAVLVLRHRQVFDATLTLTPCVAPHATDPAAASALQLGGTSFSAHLVKRPKRMDNFAFRMS